jgi:Lysyl oxidase/Bacterial Ig domain
MLALAALGLACVAAAPASAATDLLPDLVAPPPANPRLSTETLADGRSHLLLRFTGYIGNVGPGPLEIRGSDPVDGVMTRSWQRIYQSPNGYRDDASRHPRITFENADGHEHWHVQAAARFELWNEAGTAQVAPAAKVGFCLEDVEQVDPAAPSSAYDDSATQYCRQHQPDASDIREGITPGWRDVYASKLPFQWVDVSDTAPGQYRLGAQVDPNDFVIEGNEADNGPTLASDIVTVPGYTASPLSVTVKRRQTIPITATRYGAAGLGVFRIESPPRHGKLNFAAGAPVTGPVTYQPNARFAGVDTFTFSVRDTTSAFPLHSPVATARLEVAGRLSGSSRHRLLRGLRFSRRGRFLVVRARAERSGLLTLRVTKHGRRLGSSAKRARSRHRFRSRIAIRRGASPRGALLIVHLMRHGKAAARDTFRVPSRLRR